MTRRLRREVGSTVFSCLIYFTHLIKHCAYETRAVALKNRINSVFVKFAPKFKSASRSKSWSLCLAFHFDFNAEFTFKQVFLKKQNGTYITSKHPNYVINQKGNVLLQVRRHFAFKVIRVLATLSQVIFSVLSSPDFPDRAYFVEYVLQNLVTNCLPM